MRPKARKLDTLITFEARTGTQDSIYGIMAYVWASHAQEWADVEDVLPSKAEKLADGIKIQKRPVRVRTRYRDDITSDMRISYEGRNLQIVAGPVELGRRDGLEFMCVDYSTEGDQP